MRVETASTAFALVKTIQSYRPRSRERRVERPRIGGRAQLDEGHLGGDRAQGREPRHQLRPMRASPARAPVRAAPLTT
jgi:hypothetical protein